MKELNSNTCYSFLFKMVYPFPLLYNENHTCPHERNIIVLTYH
jgi:hypothetical protein